MPPVSYVTAIDIWLFVCLMSVFLSLIEYAFAYNYIKKVRYLLPHTTVTINPITLNL